ncbi:hypothetical protein Droror1_Dr00000460 [Drosera rotundifolia]
MVEVERKSVRPQSSCIMMFQSLPDLGNPLEVRNTQMRILNTMAVATGMRWLARRGGCRSAVSLGGRERPAVTVASSKMGKLGDRGKGGFDSGGCGGGWATAASQLGQRRERLGRGGEKSER